MRHLSLGMLLLAVLLLGWTAGASAAPFAYISNVNSNTVSVIDTATNTVTATVPVGEYPYGVAVHPDGMRVYVANNGSNTVSVIDTATNTVTATVPVGDLPFGVAVNPTGTQVYVTNGSTVSVINTATNTVAATVPVGAQGVAVHPDGTRVYVATGEFLAGTVSVIDTATNTVTATVPVGSWAFGIAVHPDGTQVYVANRGIDTVSVIDTATNTVVATVPVGDWPVSVAVHPDGTQVYVANGSSNTVSVIDTAINTVTVTVPVGTWSYGGIAVHPDGTRVYVASGLDDTVSVIDAATNTVTVTVPVGNTPSAFGQFIGPEVGGGPGCPATAALEGDPQKETKLEVLYDFRDKVLAKAPTGQRYIELFYKHAEEGVWLMFSYSELLSHTRTLLERFLPMLQAVVAGQEVTVTPADVADIEALLEAFAAKASPELQADLRAIQEELQQGTLLERFGIRIDHETR